MKNTFKGLQMFKIFMISFAIMSVVLTGCASKESEPQVAEEKLDLEHVKRIEEQEREQEEKAAELLAQEAALNLEDEDDEDDEKDEKEKESNDKSQTTGTDLLFEKNLTTTDANTEKVQSDDSQKDSQETKLTATIKEIFNKGAEVLSLKTTNKQEEIETLEIIEPDSSVEKSLDTLEKTSDKNTKVTEIIDNTKKDKIKPKFLPNSEPAFSSAIKLISCKEVPERMAAIHNRLLETKDINIADRKLRDSNNDTLMPVIHFDFDQIKIKKDYRILLRQQSPCVMKALEARGDMILQIEGHADERGSDEYNMALGHRRANAVSNSIIPYLSDSKLSRIFSYGEEFPLIDGSNKKAWGKNRRVEFTLLLKP